MRQEQYYVCEPLQDRMFNIIPAPTADYFTTEAEAIALAKKYNAEEGLTFELAAFVWKHVWASDLEGAK